LKFLASDHSVSNSTNVIKPDLLVVLHRTTVVSRDRVTDELLEVLVQQLAAVCCKVDENVLVAPPGQK